MDGRSSLQKTPKTWNRNWNHANSLQSRDTILNSGGRKMVGLLLAEVVCIWNFLPFISSLKSPPTIQRWSGWGESIVDDSGRSFIWGCSFPGCVTSALATSQKAQSLEDSKARLNSAQLFLRHSYLAKTVNIFVSTTYVTSAFATSHGPKSREDSRFCLKH